VLERSLFGLIPSEADFFCGLHSKRLDQRDFLRAAAMLPLPGTCSTDGLHAFKSDEHFGDCVQEDAEFPISPNCYVGRATFCGTPRGYAPDTYGLTVVFGELPVVWEETHFTDGWPGKFVVLARRVAKQTLVCARY